MDRDTLLSLHTDLCGDARDLTIRKNQDYAEADSVFGNLDLVEALFRGEITTEQGILVRLADKLSRLVSASKRDLAVTEEGARDTVLDVINYIVLWYAKHSGRGEQGGETDDSSLAGPHPDVDIHAPIACPELDLQAHPMGAQQPAGWVHVETDHLPQDPGQGKNSWIETYQGNKVWPLALTPGVLSIEDIAHSLSMRCRFSGHCHMFYSVADHSLRCADYVKNKGGSSPAELGALMHDAAEAYLADVARPIKNHLRVQLGEQLFTYSEAEDVLNIEISRQLGPYDLQDPLVKEADDVLLATEKRDLMPGRHKWLPLPAPLHPKIHPRTGAQIVRQLFLNRYAILRSAITCGE